MNKEEQEQHQAAIKKAIDPFVKALEAKGRQLDVEAARLTDMFDPLTEKPIIYKGIHTKITLSKKGYITLAINIDEAKELYEKIIDIINEK